MKPPPFFCEYALHLPPSLLASRLPPSHTHFALASPSPPSCLNYALGLNPPLPLPKLARDHREPAATQDQSSDYDHTRVLNVDGSPADCAMIEKIIIDTIPAVKHCMLVRHWTSPEVGALKTSTIVKISHAPFFAL